MLPLGDRIACSYASRDSAKAEAYRRKYRGVGTHRDYAEAIADPAIDAVVVAVPPRFHLELTLEALAAGKHVLVEKPAFLTIGDYERVRAARDGAARVVLVGENDHYKPLAVTLRRLLAAGVIGELVFAHFMTIAMRLKPADDWRNDETMAGGDAFFEEGIHWLHVAGSLGPRIRRIDGYRPAPSREGPDTRVKSMMVAFQYDNDAVGSLYYSREIPSLFRGLRVSKLFGRKGVITFESNGSFVIVRGGGRATGAVPRVPRPARLPGDVPGFCRRHPGPARAGNEPRAGDRGSAPHGPGLRQCRELRAVNPHFDIIIIGTGAGGGTIADALSSSGARILILERGDFVPREQENWDPEEVWKKLRYRAKERWLDERGNEWTPYTHYGVGGNTKFWGSVLYRLRREDFAAVEHADGISPAWPIAYETLAPYYERAERVYHVRGQEGLDPDRAAPRAVSLRARAALSRDGGDCREAARPGASPVAAPARAAATGRRGWLHSVQHLQLVRVQTAREERGRGLLRPPGAATVRTSTLWTNARAERLLTDPSGRRIDGVEVDRGGTKVRVTAPLVIVSCGAVNSAALLLRSKTDKHPHGLANSSGLVGRRYMAHLATMMQGFHPFRRNSTVFQKTVAINDFYLRGTDTPYPLGQIQSQGRTHGVMAQTAYPWIPLWPYEQWVARGVDWLAMSEDLPRLDNRVTVESDGRIRLRYRPNNVKPHTDAGAPRPSGSCAGSASGS